DDHLLGARDPELLSREDPVGGIESIPLPEIRDRDTMLAGDRPERVPGAYTIGDLPGALRVGSSRDRGSVGASSGSRRGRGGGVAGSSRIPVCDNEGSPGADGVGIPDPVRLLDRRYRDSITSSYMRECLSTPHHMLDPGD